MTAPTPRRWRHTRTKACSPRARRAYGSPKGLTWSKTSRPCARWGVAAGVGAADVPGQRRWIRLTFAGRDGMTGNRRELPLSKVAGHPRGGPHRAFEGSPCGWDHPLSQPSRAGVMGSGSAQGLVGRDRPDEPGELAGAGDDDLLVGLAAARHPPPPLV